MRKKYYAALLPRRGPHIASHSVCLSVRPVIVTECHVAPPSELQWHTCTFRHALRASVLFGTHWGPHISYGHLGRTDSCYSLLLWHQKSRNSLFVSSSDVFMQYAPTVCMDRNTTSCSRSLSHSALSRTRKLSFTVWSFSMFRHCWSIMVCSYHTWRVITVHSRCDFLIYLNVAESKNLPYKDRLKAYV